MNDDASDATRHSSSTIGDPGFIAMLRDGDKKSAGIIGTPRIDPTRSGLWIENSYPAAIDAIIVALLEDFVRHESIDDHIELGSKARPPARGNARDERDPQRRTQSARISRSRKSDVCSPAQARLFAVDGKRLIIACDEDKSECDAVVAA